MPITYTNRKGRTYYLCLGTTKTGKPRYFFAVELKGIPVEALPTGYQIQESVNSVVSLSKIQPRLLSEEDIQVVKMALQAHHQAHRYRLDVKPKMITIYEHVGPDLMELGAHLDMDFGRVLTKDFVQDFEAHHGQFIPILRFILIDTDRHTFKAQRMCYLGSIDDWIDIAFDKQIAELANAFIPTLGSDAFFALY